MELTELLPHYPGPVRGFHVIRVVSPSVKRHHLIHLVVGESLQMQDITD